MRNRKLIELVTLLLIAIAVVASCKKSNNEITNGRNSGNIFYQIKNASIDPSIKEDGIFFFQSNVTNNDSSAAGIGSFNGFFYDSAGNTQKTAGSVVAGGKRLVVDSFGNYGFNDVSQGIGFYGKTIVFSLTPPVVTPANSITVTDSLYLPAAIYFTSIPPRTPMDVQLGLPVPITWNRDPRNVKGVVIMAQYLPTQYQNSVARANGHTEVLSNTIVLPDNGNGVLPASFLAGFSKQTTISLWIARGNFALIKYNNYNYEIGAYSASAIWEVTLH